jgi:hypothetical protein
MVRITTTLASRDRPKPEVRGRDHETLPASVGPRIPGFSTIRPSPSACITLSITRGRRARAWACRGPAACRRVDAVVRPFVA